MGLASGNMFMCQVAFSSGFSIESQIVFVKGALEVVLGNSLEFYRCVSALEGAIEVVAPL